MIDKNEKELKPGQRVLWTSQAGGFEKIKYGRVLALIGENEQINKTLASIKGMLEDHFIPQSRVKAQNVAGIKRVLVGVKRKTGIEDYYAPRPGQLEIVEPLEPNTKELLMEKQLEVAVEELVKCYLDYDMCSECGHSKGCAGTKQECIQRTKKAIANKTTIDNM